jgi:hypothetical protein
MDLTYGVLGSNVGTTKWKGTQMAEMYFAGDGNWGGAYGLVVIDTEKLNQHFEDYIESVSEHSLAEWAEWFSKNDHANPDDPKSENPLEECRYCENFGIGTLAEIDKELAEEE